MSSSEDIAAELEKTLARLAEMEAFFEPVKNKQAAILAEKMALQESYHASMEVIKKRQFEIDEENYKAHLAVTALKNEAKQLEFKASQAKDDEAKEIARQERELANAALTERFDKETMSAKWREWAKDHQIEAGHKIVQDRYVILADPMGLGKTLSSIITVEMAERATRNASPEFPFLGEEKDVWVPGQYQWADGTMHSYGADQNGIPAEFIKGHNETQIVGSITRPVGRRVLYLCPSSLLRNVLAEFRMWAPHRNVTYVGGMTKAERNFVFEYTLPNLADFVIICNYEAWRKDTSLLDKFVEIDFDTIIIDEAHNAKDPKSIAYRGIMKVIQESKPEYVIPMTGTPILNRPQELWSLLSMVNKEEFTHLNDFLYSFCQQNEDGFWQFQPGGLDRIAKRISKNFMRRTKDQAGIDLPAKTVIHHDLELDEASYPNQARVRKQMRDFATIMIDESKGSAISAAAMIAVFTRLRQVETWPAGIKVENKDKQNGKWVVLNTQQVDVEESQKIDYVIRMDPNTKEWDGLIPEAIEDERIVLFSQFKAPLRELQKRVAAMGKSAVILDGETSSDLKDQIHRDFDARYTPNRADAKWDIVLCNYRVGGVGLNLTAATQLIALDEEWNPGKRDQAYDRIHRIGQEKPVTIHVIRNQKTIDDWLAGIMEAKEAVVDGFNSTMVTMSDFKDALDSGLI